MKITTNTLHARLLQSIQVPKLFLSLQYLQVATVSDSTASAFSTSLPFPSCYVYYVITPPACAISDLLTEPEGRRPLGRGQ